MFELGRDDLFEGYGEYDRVIRSQARRERDEDGEYDARDDGGAERCPDHPNHPLIECELCQAEEDEEIQDDPEHWCPSCNGDGVIDNEMRGIKTKCHTCDGEGAL